MEKMISKRGVAQAQLVMEAPEDYAGGYQFSILSYNRPEGFLPVSECSEDMTRRFYYDVTGCSCLEDMMIRGRMDAAMVAQLIEALWLALSQTEEYLLDGGKICLDPAYIYYRNDRFYFCYIPFKESDFDWEFQQLAAFIAGHTDPADERAADMANRLEEMSRAYAVDLDKLKALTGEPKAKREAVLMPEIAETLEEEDPDDETTLPWDDWHIESKPGLFRWP